jgi:hypothetical protein
VREPAAWELRLAKAGEGSGGGAADDGTATRELAIPTATSDPATRTAAATPASRALRAARIDAALLAWAARRDRSPEIKSEPNLESAASVNHGEADQSAFEELFAELADRGL